MLTDAEFMSAYQSKDFNTYSACVRMLGHKEIIGKALRKPGKITWHRDDDIPPLAWLTTSFDNPQSVRFILGARVEQTKSTFFEGVWDGPVRKAGFRRSSNFFGTGCSFHNYLVFTPPRHCFDAIYVATSNGVTHVTNSLALLIRTALPYISNANLGDLALRLKQHSDDSTKLGADLSDHFATQQNGWSLHRVMYHNFGIADDGHPVRVFHHEQRPAETFEAYQANLRNVVQTISANAQSKHRKFPFSVVSTISNGYDSPACTAIAKSVGCTLAHTISGDVRGRSDSGDDVGAQLGISVKSHPHILKSSVDSLALHFDEESLGYSAEFLATSGLGDDVVFASFGEDIHNCVVFEGSFGDGIWAKRLRTGAGLPTGLKTAKSKSEFHVRTGTIFVPMPVIGAKFAQGIRKVLTQPDMAPYVLGNSYDRPIPRRIVEEAGGLRESFGQRKGATAPTPKKFEAVLAKAFRIVMARYKSLDSVVVR